MAQSRSRNRGQKNRGVDVWSTLPFLRSLARGIRRSQRALALDWDRNLPESILEEQQPRRNEVRSGSFEPRKKCSERIHIPPVSFGVLLWLVDFETNSAPGISTYGTAIKGVRLTATLASDNSVV